MYGNIYKPFQPNYFMATKKKKIKVRKNTSRKRASKKVMETKTRTTARMKSVKNDSFLRQELLVSGLFIVAGGILWLASELKMINIDPVATPFLMITLGFIIAVGALKAR